MGKYTLDRKDINESAPIWAKRIDELLSERNMTQKELSKESKVSEATLSNWIYGKKSGTFTEPKIESLKEVAKALGVSVDYLAGLSKSKKTGGKYKVGSEFFGLSDKAMKLLHYLKWCKADEEIDFEEPDNTLALINSFLENYLFWKRFQPLFFEYSRGMNENLFAKEITEKGLWKGPLPIEQCDTDTRRYWLSRTFEKLIDDCKDDVFPLDLSKAISSYVQFNHKWSIDDE